MSKRDKPRESSGSGLLAALLAGAAAVNVELDDKRALQLLDYLRLLDKWNASTNLSGVSGIRSMLDRHVLDSLSIAPWVQAQTVADAGSGAGLPGIPLAVLYPEKHFVLIDSNGKKARFLFQAKLDLGLENLDIVHGRIEQFRGPVELVVCRALAALGESLAKTRHLLAGGAMLVAMRGRLRGRELARLPEHWQVEFVEELRVPGAASRHVVGISHRGPGPGRN